MWVEIGLQLKQAREALGLSFDDLQDKTRVPKSYLQALENGEFNKLPSPFYCRSYLRSFAEQVGLEPTTLLRKYRLSTTGPTTTVSAESANHQTKPVGQKTGHMPQVRDSQTTGMPQVTGRMQQTTGHLPQVSGRVHQTTGYLPQVTGRHSSQVKQQTMQMPALMGRAVHDEKQSSQGGARAEGYSGRHQRIERHGSSVTRETGIATTRISSQTTGLQGMGTFGEQATNSPRRRGLSENQQDSTEFELTPLPARSSKRSKGDQPTETRLSRLEVATTREAGPDPSVEQQSFLPAPVDSTLSRRNSSRHRKAQAGGKKGAISIKMVSWIAAAVVLIPAGVWGGSTLFGGKQVTESAQKNHEDRVVKDEVNKKPGQTQLSSKNPKVKLISEKSGVASYQLIEPGEIVVEISPDGVCWVQIQDGSKKVLQDDTLRAGYKPIVYQHSQGSGSDLVIVLGAPENVKVKLNGQSIKATQKIHISQ